MDLEIYSIREKTVSTEINSVNKEKLSQLYEWVGDFWTCYNQTTDIFE